MDRDRVPHVYHVCRKYCNPLLVRYSIQFSVKRKFAVSVRRNFGCARSKKKKLKKKRHARPMVVYGLEGPNRNRLLQNLGRDLILIKTWYWNYQNQIATEIKWITVVSCCLPHLTWITKNLKMRIRCSKAICLLTSENNLRKIISSIFSTSGKKAVTMINFSVSRPWFNELNQCTRAKKKIANNKKVKFKALKKH